MIRLVPSALTVFVAAGLQLVVFEPQQRDPQQPQPPQVRRIAVGNASISGIVTTSDTGRPVRGARVVVNGSMTAEMMAAIRAAMASPAVSALPGAAQTPTSARGISAGIGPGTQGPTSTSRTAITDAQGSFSIEHLPAGQYSIEASRTSFLNTSYGQKKPGGPGTAITIVDGQKVSVKLAMVRGGVITGRVTGEDGEPINNLQVRASRYVNNNGVKRLQTQNYASTDDRGEYRLFGLQPGDYLVSATPNNNEMMTFDRMMSDSTLIEQAIASGAVQPPSVPGMPATVSIAVATGPVRQPYESGPPGYLPIYHPAVAAPIDATRVRITGGDDHPNTDIQVRYIQATSIQGTVTNAPDGETAVQLSLINDDPTAEYSGGARADQTGHFSFRAVPPGKYTIVAYVVPSPTVTLVNGMSQRPSGPPPQLTESQKLWGRTPIEVSGEPTLDASVTMRPGRTVSGQLVFDMERQPDLSRAKMTVGLYNAPGMMMPSYGQMPQADVGPDGRFTITAVPAGTFMFRLPGTAKSAIVDGEDTLDGGFNFNGMHDVNDAVLTITDKYTEISGVLTDGAGKLTTNFTVIAATVDERYWTPGSRRVVASRQSPDGRYILRNLPPGTYVLAAVADFEYGTQYDPDLLKSLITSGGMRITLIEGSRVTQDLRVGR